MDRVTNHHETVRALIEEYAADWKPIDGTRIEPVIDSEHGHYLIVRSGWANDRFDYRALSTWRFAAPKFTCSRTKPKSNGIVN